jgi:hypothetical protein
LKNPASFLAWALLMERLAFKISEACPLFAGVNEGGIEIGDVALFGREDVPSDVEDRTLAYGIPVR